MCLRARDLHTHHLPGDKQSFVVVQQRVTCSKQVFTVIGFAIASKNEPKRKQDRDG